MRRAAEVVGRADGLRGAQFGQHLRRFLEEGADQFAHELGARGVLQFGEGGSVDHRVGHVKPPLSCVVPPVYRPRSPAFGFHLMELLAVRLGADMQRAELRAAPPQPVPAA